MIEQKTPQVSIKMKLLVGLTTFLPMAYILAFYPTYIESATLAGGKTSLMAYTTATLFVLKYIFL